MTKRAANPVQRKQLAAEARRAAHAARLAASVLLQMNLRSGGGRRP